MNNVSVCKVTCKVVAYRGNIDMNIFIKRQMMDKATLQSGQFTVWSVHSRVSELTGLFTDCVTK